MSDNRYDESKEYYQLLFKGRKLDPTRLEAYRGTDYYADVERYVRVLGMVDELKLSRDAHVLDLGAGGGVLSSALSGMFDIVSSCDMLETPDMKDARRSIPGIRFTQAALPQLPFQDHIFDLVVFSEVIEHLHFSDQEPATDEVFRVLKKNAWCVLSTPNPTGIYPTIHGWARRAKQAMGISVQSFKQPIENWLTRSELTRLFGEKFTINHDAASYYLPPLMYRLPNALANLLYDISEWGSGVRVFKRFGLYQYYLLRKNP